MLISSAIFSLTPAVGVGFLLNSISSVVNWSCVALCLFWFFCCWVRVLFRGGRREALLCVAEAGVEGEGVWEFLPVPVAELGVGAVAPDDPPARVIEEAGVSAWTSGVAISGWGEVCILSSLVSTARRAKCCPHTKPVGGFVDILAARGMLVELARQEAAEGVLYESEGGRSRHWLMNYRGTKGG